MLDPRSKEFEEKFRARYEALFPEIDARRLPGDRNWLDRVASWEDFLIHGADAARCLRPSPDAWFPEEQIAERNLYPQLADLVLEAFPESS